MRVMKKGIVFIILCVTSVLTAQNQRSQLLGQIKKIIRNEAQSFTPSHTGYAIGVLVEDSTYLYTFGTYGRAGTRPITDSTLFPLGGVTHAVLNLCLMNQFELGRIQFTDSLIKFLDMKNQELNSITIGQLMSHTSGLPKLLPGMSHLRTDAHQPFGKLTEDTIDHYLTKLSPKELSDKQYKHSQYNYYLLAKILQSLDSNYITHFNNFSGQLITSLLDSSRQLLPQFYSTEGREMNPLDYGGLNQSLGLYGDMRFLTNLAGVYITSYRSNSILYESLTPLEKRASPISTAGFRIYDGRKSGPVYIMTGNSQLSSCIFILCPGTKTAVVAAGNSGYSLHILAIDIMRMINFEWKRKNIDEK